MLFRIFTALCMGVLGVTGGYAQEDSNQVKNVLRSHINALAAPYMQGRGYVGGGLGLAADYVENQFKKYGMAPLKQVRGYRQQYQFAVNTFPGKMEVALNGAPLVAGKDYLVDAASKWYKAAGKKVKYKDIGGISNVAEWKKAIETMDDKYVWLLQNTDSFCKHTGMPIHGMSLLLPQGCYIIPVKTKQNWTVADEAAVSTVLYVHDSVLPTNVTTADINIEAKMEDKFRSNNIIATIPGMSDDSFIVFSAHYDHLGRMGNAIFPGASDNASGTAMMLYLAEYFAKHRPKYTMVFIAFSGEEAGLKGSAHFVEEPPIRLERIKFLTNVDIMGDATGGVTVVNATEFPEQFARLTAINNEHQYIPEVRSRGKARNSDHYYFTEKGVPAFFIYSNGGKGYYHDIYDRAEEITLNRAAGVAKLMVAFIEGL